MVLFLTVLVLIALAVAAPKVAKSIQRDKEIELIHRGEQYKRAIKLYYKKFGAYPTSIDQLLDTNNIRFLRKRYTDPITGKDDWRLIYVGQAKVPPMGLFGQPLVTASSIPGAVNIGTPIAGATAGASGSGSSSFGSSSFGSSGFGSTGPDSGGTTTTAGSSTIDGSGSASSSSDTDTGTDSSTPSGTGSSVFATSDNPGSSPTIGGGPIMGVGIPVKKASLLEYKKQKHYNEWEFDYYPMEDLMQTVVPTAGVSDNPGTGFGNNTNGSNGFGTNSTFGSDTGSSSGSSSSSGGTTSSPTQPTGTNPDQQQQ